MNLKKYVVLFLLIGGICYAPQRQEKGSRLKQRSKAKPWDFLSGKERKAILDEAIKQERIKNAHLYTFVCKVCAKTKTPYTTKHQSYYDIHMRNFHQMG